MGTKMDLGVTTVIAQRLCQETLPVLCVIFIKYTREIWLHEQEASLSALYFC